MTAGDDDVDMEDTGAEPSKVGKKLTELTTRRVIIITLGMILMLPLLDQSVLRDDYGKSTKEKEQEQEPPTRTTHHPITTRTTPVYLTPLPISPLFSVQWNRFVPRLRSF